MSKPRVKARSLSCTAVDFVEVELPQPVTLTPANWLKARSGKVVRKVA